jgi:cell division protein FtsI (penicillin-binding protein 3)
MRFKIVKAVYFLIIALVLIRLFYWQVIKSDDLIAMAEGQRVTSSEIISPRGSILFSDGSTLATSQPSFLVFAQPKLIKDKVNASKQLAQIFYPLEPNTENTTTEEKDQIIKDLEKSILEKLSKDLFWVSLNRTVNYETKQKIDSLGIEGIGFDQGYTRFYPEGSSSAHLLGFVGSDVYGNKTGYFGLEGYYNGELKGKSGLIKQEKDAQGLPILIGKFFSQESKPGKTLVLNIDRTAQYIAEQKIKAGIEKYGAKGGGVVIMDPHTGAILALASYPNYDPEKLAEFPKDFFKNPLIADGYEPGSTFKVVTMAAAINEDLVKPSTECDNCGGPVSIGGFNIRTWNNKYQPHLTMTDTIIHSDNTGMVFISKKLGIDKMFDYLKKFGVGELTDVDLQDEQTPDLRPKKDWREIDLATASFGQGISLTGLQVTRAVSVIANGGKLMEPHIVSQIKDNGSIYTISPKVVGEPIKKAAAEAVKEMMVQAVDKGEAQYYKKFEGVGSFKIAGKTGTAQIPVAGHYDPNKTIASFVGFAPADNPKFVMLVRYDQPSSSIYGADTAAPTFFAIAKELFNYYGIAPDQP